MPKVLTAAFAAAVTGVGVLTAVSPAVAGPAVGSAGNPVDTPISNCQLANGIKHVIHIQFDNVHLTRDNPNVPSDLEEMPSLLNFMKNNGVVLSNTHDVLSHTATNFIANQTGLYPDRTDVIQSNSFNYFDQAGATHTGVSFAYWTDPLYDPSGHPADTRYNIGYTADRSNVPNGNDVNAPAPWVPYTRAGCDVGEVGMSNTVLENIATDIPTVFGADSPQAAEAKANPAKATADVVGFAVHCAAGSATCASGQSDVLPDEPGGYGGHQALFGNAQIQPAVSPSGPITAMDGSAIADPKGNPGFPGFDSMTPNNALGYAATLLEHNVQIANVYVSDAHRDHNGTTGDLGPGEQTYVDQLHSYDTAFSQFLARLANDGITPANTLFSVTTDEGDHFSGSTPTPADCTGEPGNYCSYAIRSEVNVNLPGLLATQYGDTTPFAIHSDAAPSLWVKGNPVRTDPAVRKLERELTATTIANPLTGATDKLAYALADPVEEKILHFIGSDPARVPTMTAFSGEDEYVGGGAQNCTRPCVYTSQGYAWDHGGMWSDMQTIWSSYAGPGVSARGLDDTTWSDQTDNRPTVLALTGLRDDYRTDGRVLIEDLAPEALPVTLRAHREQLMKLSRAYKQILASNSQFAQDTLAVSTKAVASGSSTEDQTYAQLEASLIQLNEQRDSLAGQINEVLQSAAFDNQQLDPRQAASLQAQAEALLAAAHALAES